MNSEYVQRTTTHTHRVEKKQTQQKNTNTQAANCCTILLLTHALRVKLASDICARANISVKYTITERNCKLYQVVWHSMAWQGMVLLILSFPLFVLFFIPHRCFFSHSFSHSPNLVVSFHHSFSHFGLSLSLLSSYEFFL